MSIESLLGVYFGLDYSEQQVKAKKRKLEERKCISWGIYTSPSDKKLPNKVSADVLYRGMSIESLLGVYFGLDYSEQQVKAKKKEAGSWVGYGRNKTR